MENHAIDCYIICTNSETNRQPPSPLKKGLVLGSPFLPVGNFLTYDLRASLEIPSVCVRAYVSTRFLAS